MASEYINLDCQEEMGEELLFPEDDCLTDEILAGIDVIQIGRQEALVLDFPKCSISSPTEDILQHAMNRTFNDSNGQEDNMVNGSFQSNDSGMGEEVHVRADIEAKPISVDISSARINLDIPVTAKKSKPKPRLDPTDGSMSNAAEQGTKSRDWKVSELESVRMHFSSKLESVRIGKCQNWKVSQSESVRIGKCQNWKVSELESVRIGKCQNRKVSELESVRIIWSLKIPYK